MQMFPITADYVSGVDRFVLFIDEVRALLGVDDLRPIGDAVTAAFDAGTTPATFADALTS